MFIKFIIFMLLTAVSVIFGEQILCGHRGPENINLRGTMETHISLHKNGTMTGTTVLKSKKNSGGFQGGVGIAFFDENQRELWHSDIHEYTVKIKRTREWTDQVPLKILPQIKNLAIVQQQTPTSTFWANQLKVSQSVWNGLSNDNKKPK